MLSQCAFETMIDKIFCTDLLTLCGGLPSQSVDMILCDLPYGTTACHWDSIIPLEPMWAQFKRVIKPRGAIVLTASQPFTSKLVMSAIDWFRYEWVWQKNIATQFLDAKHRPMKEHENILIFSDGLSVYHPQFEMGEPYQTMPKSPPTGIYGSHYRVPTTNDGWRYPRSIVKVNSERGLHPTQKPVALFEYLIRTYTQPGELVLDPCIGSGTTAIAARQTGRHFIGGDLTSEYAVLANKRVAMPYTPPLFLDE